MKASRHFLNRPIQMQSAENSEPFFSPKQQSETAEAQQPFFAPTGVQTKLEVNAPGDKYEQEADAMADKVVQRAAAPTAQGIKGEEEDKVQKMSKPEEEEKLQRKCASCEQEEEVHRKESGDTGGSIAPTHVAQQINSSKGSGSPLNDKTRSEMESSFGTDFSNVRIHDDSQSADLSQDLHAHAFTHGSDVYFNQGKYAPESSDGKRLLAHELTHVVQQGAGVESKVQRNADCDNEHIACYRRCKRRRPPWPIDKGTWAHSQYCASTCLAEYMLCEGERAVERAFNSMAEATRWLAEHPEVIIGTIVVVAGVAFIVSTGGTGALILVAI